MGGRRRRGVWAVDAWCGLWTASDARNQILASWILRPAARSACASTVCSMLAFCVLIVPRNDEARADSGGGTRTDISTVGHINVE